MLFYRLIAGDHFPGPLSGDELIFSPLLLLTLPMLVIASLGCSSGPANKKNQGGAVF
jgi:hypothetical protein